MFSSIVENIFPPCQETWVGWLDSYIDPSPELVVAIILLLRIFVPFLIFKKPFLGAILAMLVDLIDFCPLAIFAGDYLVNYQFLDKILDLYYLTFEFIVVTKWVNKEERVIGKVLFFYRLIGIILFEVFQIRWFLIAFPNIFENYFLFVTGYKFFTGIKREIKRRHLWIGLIVISIFKMIQEVHLHG